jgi:hypothetical protein
MKTLYVAALAASMILVSSMALGNQPIGTKRPLKTDAVYAAPAAPTAGAQPATSR